MLPLIAMAALAGLAKSELIDRPKEQRQRKLAAETQRLSPWTHLQADPIKEADPFGSALQFGAAGAQLGQNMDTADLQQEQMKLNNELLKQKVASGEYGGSGPWGGGQSNGTGYLGAKTKF